MSIMGMGARMYFYVFELKLPLGFPPIMFAKSLCGINNIIWREYTQPLRNTSDTVML